MLITKTKENLNLPWATLGILRTDAPPGCLLNEETSLKEDQPTRCSSLGIFGLQNQKPKGFRVTNNTKNNYN